MTSSSASQVTLRRDKLDTLFDLLTASDYTIIGPTVRNQTLLFDQIEEVKQLPVGYQDHQAPGEYRLTKTERPNLFDYTLGSQSPKRWFYPASQELWQADKTKSGFKVAKPVNDSDSKPLALIGVRPCELKALKMHDRILSRGDHADARYALSRQHSLIVAVNCTRPGGNCFCVSMNCGPQANDGYDLVMTEVLENEEHYFVLKPGSELGKQIISNLPVETATPEQLTQVERLLDKATAHMGRKLDLRDVKETIEELHDSPHWHEVAGKCLSCGNCTLVCPTCFCTGVTDQTDLTATTARRVRQWDSCFMVEFSYIHGGSIRHSVKSRYRQWLSHKFAYWHDQFDEAGCVGCGRCITWCPVGIDITEEVGQLVNEREPIPVA